jgi:hypothetical protein
MKEYKFNKDFWFITDDLNSGKLVSGETLTSNNEVTFFDSVDVWELEKKNRGIKNFIFEETIDLDRKKNRTIRVSK